jgi:hypothetical protein
MADYVGCHWLAVEIPVCIGKKDAQKVDVKVKASVFHPAFLSPICEHLNHPPMLQMVID